MEGPKLSESKVRKRAASSIYTHLREAIIGNELSPSAKVSELELAERFNVSRTPIREALARLQNEGLVTVRPRHGTYIAPISVADLFEAHAIRTALEILIAETAARRGGGAELLQLETLLERQVRAHDDGRRDAFQEADDAMHRHLAVIAGLPRAATMVDSVAAQLTRARLLSLRDPARSNTVIDEHRKLLSAIGKGDPEAAAQAMREHLENAFHTIRSLMSTHPTLFSR